MRAIDIRIRPFHLAEVLECVIVKQVNDHMSAYLSGHSSDNDRLEKLGPDTEVSIEITDEEGASCCIFRGLLSQLTRIEEGALTKLEIRARSRTALLDCCEQTRFFYNENQTYQDIVRRIGLLNESVSVIYVEESRNTCGLAAQYRETDWEFLKRLASRLNTVLIPDCTNSHTCFYFGLPQKKRADFDIASYELRSGKGLREYVVESREILELCTPVLFQGFQLFVYKMESRFERGELTHRYYLRTRKGFFEPRLGNEKIIGASFLGTVSEVRREMVRVACECGCDANGEETVWFPYSTVYSSPGGTGWYCMPEEGDRIRIYFPNDKEPDAYVVSAVHVDSQGEMRKNPEEKSLRTKYDKEIRFTPETILITNHKGMSIVLDDKKGILIQSDRSVSISAGEGIEIESGGGASIVAGRGILFRENHNSLTIRDGIRHTGLTIEYQ